MGRSVHSAAEAIAAEASGGCDYLVFGTVFESESKPAGHRVAGLGALAEVCAAVRLPVLAIGGITPARVPDVVKAGAVGHRCDRIICGRRRTGAPRCRRPDPAGVRVTLAVLFTSMDPGYRSPLVDLFLKGEAARDIRLMAARGLLPRPAHEQIALLVVLSDDPDPEISATANATIARLPPAALTDFLTTDAPAELRAFFAARSAEPAAVESTAPAGRLWRRHQRTRQMARRMGPTRPKQPTPVMTRHRTIPSWYRRCRLPNG